MVNSRQNLFSCLVPLEEVAMADIAGGMDAELKRRRNMASTATFNFDLHW